MSKPSKKKGYILLPLLLALFLFSPAINLCAGEQIKKDTIKLYRDEYRNLLLLIDNSVKLPLTEYNNLLQEIIRAENKKKEEEKKDQDTRKLASYKKYNITDGKLNCAIKDGFMEVKADLSINFLTDGWKEVPLRILPGLSSLQIDQKSSALKNEGNSSYTLISDLKGKHEITFKFHPVISRSQRRSVVYNSAKIEFNQRVPSVVNITYPDGAKPTGDLAKFAKANPKGVWTAVVKTDFTKPIKIEWFIPRKMEAEQVKGTYNATVNSSCIISEKMILLISIVQVEVVSGEVQEIPIKLPEGFKFIDSEIPDGVILENTDDQVMKLVLKDDAEDIVQLLLFAEADNPGNEINFTPITLDKARRTNGMLALMSEDLTINAKGTMEYQPIDIRLLPTELELAAEMDAQAGFKYSYSDKKPGELVISANKIKKSWTIDAYIKSAQYFASLNEEGILMYEMKMDVINNNKQHLMIELPENTKLQSVYIDNTNARPLKDNNGNILIPMRPKKHSLDGLVQISVTFTSRASVFGEEGQYRLTFPKLNLPVNETAVNIFLPKGYEYDELKGNLSRGNKQIKESDIEPDFVIDQQTGEYLLKNEIGNLHVYLLDQDGKTIDSTLVELLMPNGQKKSDYSSNSEILFENLRQGKYSVFAKVNPDFTGYQNDIRITAEKTREITLVLTNKKLIEKRKDLERSRAEATISSGEYDKKDLGVSNNIKYLKMQKKEKPYSDEVITVTADSPIIDISSSTVAQEEDRGKINRRLYSEKEITGAFSLKIEIPKSGIWYKFHSVLLIDEFPYLQFEYEKE
ncbi:MAG: hypothetical protein JW737_04430 [Acidobacteria bacterium]|nr:hypothetical protein [Acidobacteriota bacterium]